VVYSVRSGLCWQADLCSVDTAFPTKALLLPLNLPARANSGADRIASRAHTRMFIAHEEKFLSANFIEDDQVIAALREFLINRRNFYRNR